MKLHIRSLALPLLLLTIATFSACDGGGSSHTIVGTAYVMSITPASTTITVRTEVPIVVSITDTTDTEVTWKVDDIEITGSSMDVPTYGRFTVLRPKDGRTTLLFKPDTAGKTVKITATAVAFPDRTVTANVTVIAAPAFGNYTSNTTFSLSGTMFVPRYSHTATLLPSGNILVAGGRSSDTILVTDLELYLPSTGGFYRPGTSLSSARIGHTASILPNGNVFIAGGNNGTDALSSAEVYDYRTQVVTSLPFSSAREQHAAAVLQNGDVLLSGGKRNGTALDSAILYNYSSGVFHNLTAHMIYARAGHTATLLGDGRVLLAGGGTNSAEIYNPQTRKFDAATSSMQNSRSGHTATVLARNDTNDVIVMAGGDSGGTAEKITISHGLNNFDKVLISMQEVRFEHTAVLLQTLLGETAVSVVYVTGGNNGGTTQYKSSTAYGGTYTFNVPFSNLSTARSAHTATVIHNGKLVLIGGFTLYSTNKKRPMGFAQFR